MIKIIVRSRIKRHFHPKLSEYCTFPQCSAPLDDVKVVPVGALRDDVLAVRDLAVEHCVQHFVKVF